MALSKPKRHKLDIDLDALFAEGFAKAFIGTPFTAQRSTSEQYLDKICERIIADIKKCKLLVADVTYHKRNVYYEAGFAYGMGKPVIWSCHEKDFDPQKAQFDTRQFPHILWKDYSDLTMQLGTKIMATII
jgi:nucleoside 2-deoxyribosyltransferase